MIKQNALACGVALVLCAAPSAQAWQSRGGGGQRAGNPPAAQRGPTMRDRTTMHDRDMMRDRDRGMDRTRDMDRDRASGRMDDGSMMYGWQLMTPAERTTYREKMRTLKTRREREALRTQHHQEMQQRARDRGVQLPDMPPRRGGG
ncbi:MAG TPA: hypothetical protein VFH59_06060 [Frateuria sp.]|uniref:hypothetical protein n=1 Tax=Frateuria sp. TaxID=2211372 RepID=UPI002D7E86F7|nr:hypothetical protein [Frateuria sp.]HET6804995.1 hypothetical protein [Frateuria sp.]